MENSRKKYIIILLTITSLMVIGFAVLSSTLTLSGTTTVNANTWNIKFQNIVIDSSNNVTATTTPTISSNTNISFGVTLSKPGDKFSFTVDAVNTGSIDAMINTVSKSSLTTEQAKYLDYTVTYSDGLAISQKDKLVKTSGLETIKVTIEFKTDVSSSDLPSSVTTIDLTFGLKYVQADSTAKKVAHDELLSFITKAKAGNATSSDVGKTFTVNLGSTYGEHTLRVANVSTPAECSGAGFSGTACGVVLEFTDNITFHNMNPSGTYKDTEYTYGWNVDGWPATSMRTFVNNDIYNALPSNLKSAIIDTTVVSGHGSTSGETNFTSTDKLYLLSAHEVWSDGASSEGSNYDSSHDNTRQLDYYASLNVSRTNNITSAAIKHDPKNPSLDGDNYCAWWLRSAFPNTRNFLVVNSSGSCGGGIARDEKGVSPAFRIA